MARQGLVGVFSVRLSRAPSLIPAPFLSHPLSVPPTMSSLPNCHQYACAIQACITRNNANSDKCPREIMALYECCERLYRTLDSEGKGENKEGVPGSEACPNLVSRLSSLQVVVHGLRLQLFSSRLSFVWVGRHTTSPLALSSHLPRPSSNAISKRAARSTADQTTEEPSFVPVPILAVVARPPPRSSVMLDLSSLAAQLLDGQEVLPRDRAHHQRCCALNRAGQSRVGGGGYKRARRRG